MKTFRGNYSEGIAAVESALQSFGDRDRVRCEDDDSPANLMAKAKQLVRSTDPELARVLSDAEWIWLRIRNLTPGNPARWDYAQQARTILTDCLEEMQRRQQSSPPAMTLR